MLYAPDKIPAALRRLDHAVARLEAAMTAHPDPCGAELRRLAAALRDSEAEQANLAEANRVAAERLETTIGRLRGLIAP